MFGKLFASMYDGSLRTRSPWQALVTFQQLIVLANKDGEVDMTAEAIGLRTGIPLEHINLGLRHLEMPDPDSRTPAEEGRRIVRIDPERSWGWRIVNYDHYRKIRSQDERREYMRLHMRAKRARAKGLPEVDPVSQPLADVSNVSQGSKQYAVSSKQITTTATTSRRKRASSDDQSGETATARTTWLSPISAVWEQHFGGGSFSGIAGLAARSLSPLTKAGRTSDEIAGNLATYLSTTAAQYVSLPKFAQTFGQWTQQSIVDEHGFLTPAGYKAANER